MGKLAFVFSGQGAQSAGMGKELFSASPAAKEIFLKAEELKKGIIDLCFNGPDEALFKTINTQPALFTVELAAAYALKAEGIEPDMAAGFSLGEFSAVAFSGMLSFERAFLALLKRAELMHACALKNPGAMFAVLRLTKDEVIKLSSGFRHAYPVNFNCPGQTVVAVSLGEAEAFASAVKDAGARAVKLNVSGAFHCPFMEEASSKLFEHLDGERFKTPAYPVYANSTAQVYANDPAKTLSDQVKSPVRWSDTIVNMKRDGCDTIVEVGAGKTLVGFVNKIDSSIKTLNVEDRLGLEKTVAELKERNRLDVKR